MNELLELEDELDNGEGSEELYERVKIVVDKRQEPLRIDKFLLSRIENATRNKIQQAAKIGLLTVNDQPVKSNYKVKPGDLIILYSYKDTEVGEVVPENIPLNILYEDDDLLVVNKSAGMVVHPGCGNYTGTLVNALAYHLSDNPSTDAIHPVIPRFGLVHRIDKNTSGLLVIAKSEEAMTQLAKQFYDHTVNRRYVALVWGDFEEDEGTICAHVGRHQRFRKIMDAYPDGEHGKAAITHYKVLERFNYVTLIECRLETGRTHQIRVHMQHIGHPLFNDDTYGGDKIVKGTIFSKYKQFVENCFAVIPRHALHARSLGFIHPTTHQEVCFESELPADMKAVIEKWRRYVNPQS